MVAATAVQVCWRTISHDGLNAGPFVLLHRYLPDNTAYAASLARGDALDERIRVATAAAALKARDGEIPHRLAV